MEFYTADMCDELDDGVQVLDDGFVSYGGKKHFKGKIEIVTIDGNNASLIEVLKEEGEGRVCVVDVRGKYVAVVGENLMKLADQNNWSGILVHGYIRDTIFTREIDVGLLALGTCPKKDQKVASGTRGKSVTFGGVEFVVGHTLYADDDGVITVNEL